MTTFSDVTHALFNLQALSGIVIAEARTLEGCAATAVATASAGGQAKATATVQGVGASGRAATATVTGSGSGKATANALVQPSSATPEKTDVQTGKGVVAADARASQTTTAVATAT